MKNSIFKFILIFALLTIAINIANALQLNSPDFNNNNTIPKQITCDGNNKPPILQWQVVPKNTKSLVLVVSDPDAPAGIWYHWLLFNIPSNKKQLTYNDTNLLKAINIGKNSWQHEHYDGPCPPKGQTHRYLFTLYALDIPLQIPSGVQAKDVFLAMQNHILATAVLQETYQH